MKSAFENLNQDEMNSLSAYLPYKNDLLYLSQASTQMRMLVNNTPAGQFLQRLIATKPSRLMFFCSSNSGNLSVLVAWFCVIGAFSCLRTRSLIIDSLLFLVNFAMGFVIRPKIEKLGFFDRKVIEEHRDGYKKLEKPILLA